MNRCLARIDQLLPQMAPSEYGAASYISEHPKDAASMGIAELARISDSSTAAIIRLCKRIGFKGFSDFKFALIQDAYTMEDEQSQDILDVFDDKILPGRELIPRFLSLTGHGLDLLGSVLDGEQVDLAANLLSKASQIAIFGLGASAIVGMDLQYKLARLGKKPIFTQDPDLQQVYSCSIGSDDIAFIISYSGETQYLFNVAREARKNGSKVISITMAGRNTIFKLSDVRLQVPVSETEYRQGATLSRLNQLVVIDILYSAMLGRMDEEEKKAIRRSWDSVSEKRHVKTKNRQTTDLK